MANCQLARAGHFRNDVGVDVRTYVNVRVGFGCVSVGVGEAVSGQ